VVIVLEGEDKTRGGVPSQTRPFTLFKLMVDLMVDGENITKCPFCNQMARREDLNNGTHVCWGPNDNSHKTLGIWG
jgi:hypothetical protein